MSDRAVWNSDASQSVSHHLFSFMAAYLTGGTSRGPLSIWNTTSQARQGGTPASVRAQTHTGWAEIRAPNFKRRPCLNFKKLLKLWGSGRCSIKKDLRREKLLFFKLMRQSYAPRALREIRPHLLITSWAQIIPNVSHWVTVTPKKIYYKIKTGSSIVFTLDPFCCKVYGYGKAMHRWCRKKKCLT